ncbi:MAG: hypothetical protein H0T53_15575 [Herpetosiphonaceae bacterium]|nr:hypothetical protein [Herpetosiphonaceae bacterium]
MPIPLLTVPEVAALCQVSESTILRDIEFKHLKPRFQAGGEQRTRYLMTQEDVEAYQAWRTTTTAPLLTVPEVAFICHLFEGMIRRDIERGHLNPSYQAGGAQRTRYLMTQEDVDAYQAWRRAAYGDDYNAAYARDIPPK